MDILYLLAGLAGLVLGGEMLVRGAVSLAERFGLPPLVIGLTLVGFGTSAPELFTSLQAALGGSPGIAIGNVVGSNTGNLLLILGIAALLAPISVDPAAFRRDGAVLLAATLACVALVYGGAVGRVAGAALVASLVAHVVYTLRRERRAGTPAAAVYEGEAAVAAGAPMGPGRSLALTLAGLVVTVAAARFLVLGAVSIAAGLGVSEALIGVTIVAIGTSMPELVTAVIAVRRNAGDVAFGNVVGSNIFNILGILGITALVHPMEVPARIAGFDIWVMLAATLAGIAVSVTGWRIGRREGAALLAGYGVYLAVAIAAVA